MTDTFGMLRSLRPKVALLPTALEDFSPEEGLALAQLLVDAHSHADVGPVGEQRTAAAHYRICLATKKLVEPLQTASKAWAVGKAAQQWHELLDDLKAVADSPEQEYTEGAALKVKQVFKKESKKAILSDDRAIIAELLDGAIAAAARSSMDSSQSTGHGA